jgi:hypothetical protein
MVTLSGCTVNALDTPDRDELNINIRQEVLTTGLQTMRAIRLKRMQIFSDGDR